jgi:hypothetical protein
MSALPRMFNRCQLVMGLVFLWPNEYLAPFQDLPNQTPPRPDLQDASFPSSSCCLRKQVFVGSSRGKLRTDVPSVRLVVARAKQAVGLILGVDQRFHFREMAYWTRDSKGRLKHATAQDMCLVPVVDPSALHNQ